MNAPADPPDLQQRLATGFQRSTSELRALLSRASTAEVVWHCFHLFQMGPGKTMAEYGLDSPYKQGYFLLGLTLTTPEPTRPGHLSDSEWAHIHGILQAIETAYLRLFFPHPDEMARMSDEDRHRIEVSMVAFLRYFNTGVLASVEQLRDRARAYFAPFDTLLEQRVGLSATSAIEIVEWIRDGVQAEMDRLTESAVGTRTATERAQAREWSPVGVRSEAAARAAMAWLEHSRDPLAIRLADLEAAFGVVRVAAFRNLFMSARGSVPAEEFQYYTQQNPAERQPLVAPGGGELVYCPVFNALYVAVLTQFSAVLRSDPESERAYLRLRDRLLEERGEALFRAFFGPRAEFFVSARETPTGQYEHDLVVVWERRLIIAEAKAAPPIEPRRDVEQSFTRLRDAFRRNTGLQSAFEQTARLTRRIRQGNPVDLYNADGVLVRRIVPDEVDNAYGVCITADDFGVLAVDLSLLLEKEPSDDFPWAVSIYDLESFIDALRHKGWGPEEFCKYLDQRSKLHGRTANSDELELAGAFLKHGALPQPPDDNTQLVIHPEYSDVFDEIYAEQRGGPTASVSAQGPMQISDATAAFRAGGEQLAQLFHGTEIKDRQQRPNKRCSCGSGKKYKNCCGRRR